MTRIQKVSIACLLCMLTFSCAWSQPCYSGYVYDLHGCPGQINQINAYPNTPNATNTYVWPTNISGATLISGQGQVSANYVLSSPGVVAIPVSITSSQYGCTYIVNHYMYSANYSTPNIQGAAIPGTCTGGQVFTYYAQRWLNSNNQTGSHNEMNYWTVNGGSIISQATHVTMGGNIWGWTYTDTIKIAWNGTGPRSLILRRVGVDQNSSAPGFSNCEASDTLMPVAGPAIISGPTSGCAPFVATYTVNPDTGYTYNWAVTNGTILSGQGTTSVQISWTAPGTVSVTKSFLWCPMTYTASLNVGNGIMPSPNLGPNTTFCSGSGFVLNAGPGSSFTWNTGATTQTISPTASGTYAVTVSNGNGCTASSSVTLTMLPSPTPTIAGQTAFCINGMTTLDAGPGYTNYQWSTGVTTQTANFSSTGMVSVTVTDANGCTGTAVANLTYLPQPLPNLGPDQTVCANALPTLNPGSFSSYLWSNGATSNTLVTTSAGTYEVTVIDANGCSASDTMQLTVNALPTFSLGNDTIICADTSIVLSGIGGMSTYIWSNGTMAASTQVTAGGTYMLTVTDANGCMASDTVLIQGLTDCVFPGDANYDLVADIQDILSIGAYLGRIDAPRANASTQWYGQSTPDWGSPLPLQADPKHSDCDGDGIVDYPDTAVVHLNYGRTHSKAAGITTGGAALRVVALQDSVLPGDIAIFQVMLGDANAQVDSVYGFAFRINYTQGVTAAPGLTYVDYSNCWFAPASKRISFTEPFPANAAADLAVVRNDQQQRLGFGEICRFGILTDANMSATSAPLQVWLTQAQQVDAQLGLHALESFADSVVVSYLASGIQAGLNAVQPSIYPNPTADALHILSQGASLQQVEIVDLRGEVLMSLPGEDQSEMVLSTQALSQGMYFVRMHTTIGNSVQKLVIKR